MRELRLSAHSLELLVCRYALHTEEERAAFTGITDVERATAAVEDHLVRLCSEAFRGGCFDPEGSQSLKLPEFTNAQPE